MITTLKETNKRKTAIDSKLPFCTNLEESYEGIMLTKNTKINRLIEEINGNYTRKQIAILFLELADKPEICIDFNISLPYYLMKYLSCREEICLSESGVLILCAAKIYARRIDNIFDGIQQMLVGIEKNSKEIEKEKENNTEFSEKKKDSKPRRPPKRSLPKDDGLYESEIEPKQFKKSSEEKISDKNIFNTFEPPKNYFRCFKKYLEYRSNNKKIKNDNSKYDENADQSLYQYSTIEDFDYEDDIDSKRNYKTLHGHIEHRYSTIVSDINFLMHFKVKDFVEEELEESQRQLSLGLPQTQKRKWYSLCHNEYINGLLDLENEILEKEFDTNVTLKRRKKIENFNNNEEKNLHKDMEDRENVINFNNGNIDIFDLDKGIDVTNQYKETETEKCNKSSAPEPNINNSSIILQSGLEDNSSINPQSGLEDKLISSQDLDERLTEPQQNSNDKLLKESSVNENAVENETSNFPEKGDEKIDPKKIIVRLSCDDEGIFLSDLDDIQSAMINPKVVAVDIHKSIDKGLDFFSINLDKTLEGFLGLDEIPENEEENQCCPTNLLDINSEFLSFRQDFSLPFEIVVKKTPIILNIFKLPEKKLKTFKVFNLPEEYNLFKADRSKKRITTEKPPRVIKEPKSPTRSCSTSLSLIEEPNFAGFSQEEIDLNKLAKEKIDIDRQRTISTDSGIVISRSSNIFSSTLLSNNSQNDSGFFNETEGENLSKIISTLSQDEPSRMLENNEITTADFSVVSRATVIDDQIIVPPHTQNSDHSMNDKIENKIDKEIIENDNQHIIINKSIVVTSLNEGIDNEIAADDEFDENLLQNGDCLESLKITEKIKLWHQHLKPILVKSKGRHHFDVFNLGTEIMNKFSTKNNNIVDFRAVMQDKDPSFTSRYFLSMLLLANANNVKLNVKNKISERPTSPEDIEIVLLSTKRHTVSVQDNIGMVNNKAKTSVENIVQLFKKPSKLINNKNISNEDNDSGFFSSLSIISSENISR